MFRNVSCQCKETDLSTQNGINLVFFIIIAKLVIKVFNPADKTKCDLLCNSIRDGITCFNFVSENAQ